MIVLDYFHKTGVLAYYPDLYPDKIILQLNWVLDAIYAGIRLKENPLAKTEGRLSEKDFDLIWPEYATKDKELFKNYMLKSNIMAKPNEGYRHSIIRNYDYLLPALFPKRFSSEAYQWEEKERYIALKFKFIFTSIIEQLQVRILTHCPYESNEQSGEAFYKNYVSFTDRYGNNAVIEMKEEENEIRIFTKDIKLEQTILNEIDRIYPLDRLKKIERIRNQADNEYMYRKEKEQYLDSKEVNENYKYKAMNTKTKKKVFISYSHKEVKYKDELLIALADESRKNIEIWHDKEIEAGDNWDEEIKSKMKSSDIIILLICNNFIASSYVHEVEMRMALTQKIAGKAKVIPILLRECSWEYWSVFEDEHTKNTAGDIAKGKIGLYQLSPIDPKTQQVKPVIKWKNREDAWKQITDQVRRFSL